MFPLFAILDTTAAIERGHDPVALASRFFDGGARLLQIRAKAASSAQLLEWSDRIIALARACGAQVVVNDRADIAMMCGAWGVHVGQEDVPPAAIRRAFGTSLAIGCSTHTRAQVDAASALPIDYLAVGPVFGTRTKDTGYDPVGLDLVGYAARNARGLPVVAIGGITLATAAQVREAGAASVAVISDLLTGDPSHRVAEYLSRV